MIGPRWIDYSMTRYRLRPPSRRYQPSRPPRILRPRWVVAPLTFRPPGGPL